MTPRTPTPMGPRRSSGAGRGARSLMTSGIGRNGGWRWTCSTRSPARRSKKAARRDGVEGGVGGGGWGLPPRIAVADAGYGDITGFRLGLQQRGLPYVVAVKASTSAYPVDAVPTAPAYSGRGRPTKPRYRDDPSNLAALALAAGRGAVEHITWRHGSRRNPANPTAAMSSHFLAVRVRPANREIPRTPTAACRNAGSSPNGHPTRPNPPTTGCPTCPPTPHCPNWSDSPRSAGGSSTTTAN